MPEGWLLEEETHRNNAFVLFHAHHLPRLRFEAPVVKKVADRLWRLEVPVLNERAIPTVTARAQLNKLHRPDVATVEGGRVVASGVVEDPWLDKVTLQAHRPERLMVPGVDGLSTRILFFLVEGDGEVTVRYDSLKGGKLALKVPLRATAVAGHTSARQDSPAGRFGEVAEAPVTSPLPLAGEGQGEGG